MCSGSGGWLMKQQLNNYGYASSSSLNSVPSSAINLLQQPKYFDCISSSPIARSEFEQRQDAVRYIHSFSYHVVQLHVKETHLMALASAQICVLSLSA
ncbi:unnamed protein product [Anisakis simplex]|uniref:Ovule protein n=1 Tax=Anisakis simplex TaxID=6269 RepID=A0A0M3KB33_ANISI|nr:unnamed protein product [Anisakis simplex]